MSTQRVKDHRDALVAAGFTGDQAAQIIAADMVASQLADLNKTVEKLRHTLMVKKF